MAKDTSDRVENDADEQRLELRAFLYSYIKKLPQEQLRVWIDGLWLGNASDAQLSALLNCVVETERLKQTAPKPRGRGRPPTEQLLPGIHPTHNVQIREQWARLTTELRAFSIYRQRHYAKANKKRNGSVRSFEHRDACQQSAIGQRVTDRDLFDEFFDALPRLIPTEMAAKLLHREMQARLEATVARAAARRSSVTRSMAAAKAAESLNRLPAWATLYKNIRRKPAARG